MTNQQHGSCILCGCSDLVFVHVVRDSDQHFIFRCKNCGHIQLSPLPTEEEERAFYQTNAMGRNAVPNTILDDESLRKKNKVYIDQQVRFASKLIPKGKSIFEIGSGYGWFVSEMQHHGYAVSGLELSTEKCVAAQRDLNVFLHNLSFPKDALPADLLHSYDYVCIFHVLEHVPNPVQFLAAAKQLLKPGGTILAEVPNYNDHMKDLSPEYNSFTYLRAHLSYFSPSMLKTVLHKAGLTNIQLYGEQKYSISNALRWINEKKPNLLRYEFDVPEGLAWVDEYYKTTLEKNLQSYALVATGTI